MDDNMRVERWTLDDGRRAERRVMELADNSGEAERVIEFLVEDERPLRLKERVVERKKPFVYERKIETLDPDGNVVEQKVESVEPKVQMQLVEHLISSQSVHAQAASQENDCDCHVTKEEMIDTIVAAIKATRNGATHHTPSHDEAYQVRAMSTAKKLKSLGLAEEVADRVENKEYSLGDKILFAVIAAQVVGLAYMIFGM